MTKEEIVEAIANNKMLPYINPDFLPGIVDFVLDNSQPSLPSNLDEAAEKNFETMEVLEHENIFEETHRKIFEAGAEWMAGQGVTKEAVIGMATEEISINVSQKALDALRRFNKKKTNG